MATAEISGNLPKGFLHNLGPEDLLLVQVDSAVTVSHPVWPRVWRDVFGFSCTQKSEKEQQEGESEQLLDRNAAERKICLFFFFVFFRQSILYIRLQSGKPIVRKEGSCVAEEKKRGTAQ